MAESMGETGAAVQGKQGLIKRIMQRNRIKATGYLQDPVAMQNLLTNVQQKARITGAVAPLEALRGQLGLMWRMLRSWQKGAYKQAPKGVLISAVAALIYFIAPIDALPDFILGTGFLDDAAVLAFVLRSIAGDLKQYADWETLEEAKRIIALNAEKDSGTATASTTEAPQEILPQG